MENIQKLSDGQLSDYVSDGGSVPQHILESNELKIRLKDVENFHNLSGRQILDSILYGASVPQYMLENIFLHKRVLEEFLSDHFTEKPLLFFSSKLPDRFCYPPTVNIAFTGKAGAGKSTASDYLIELLDAKKVSFAKPLYELMYHIQSTFGLCGKKDRTLLQFLGEHARKTAIEEGKPDPILSIMEKRFDSIPKNRYGSFGTCIVLDDLRMKMERDFLKTKNFYMFRIVGRSHDQSEMSGGSKTHKTEVDLDGEEFETIDNSFDNVEDFKKHIELIACRCLFLEEAKGILSLHKRTENPEIFDNLLVLIRNIFDYEFGPLIEC